MTENLPDVTDSGRDMTGMYARGAMECGASSEEIPGFGHLYCERRPGHEGPHREWEDGHVWEQS